MTEWLFSSCWSRTCLTVDHDSPSNFGSFLTKTYSFVSSLIHIWQRKTHSSKDHSTVSSLLCDGRTSPWSLDLSTIVWTDEWMNEFEAANWNKGWTRGMEVEDSLPGILAYFFTFFYVTQKQHVWGTFTYPSIYEFPLQRRWLHMLPQSEEVAGLTPGPSVWTFTHSSRALVTSHKLKKCKLGKLVAPNYL